MSGPQLAVGAVAVVDDQLLLVRRGHGPGAGRWSIPGGRVETDEPVAAAVIREVGEETGLDVVVDDLLGWAERFDEGHHFVILDFAVTVLDTDITPRPGDDAAEAAWVPLADLGDYQLVDGLTEFLDDAGVLDPAEG